MWCTTGRSPGLQPIFPAAFPGLAAQWLPGGASRLLTVAGPRRILTGFPRDGPGQGAAAHPEVDDSSWLDWVSKTSTELPDEVRPW